MGMIDNPFCTVAFCIHVRARKNRRMSAVGASARNIRFVLQERKK